MTTSFTGVDMGTSRIVCVRPIGAELSLASELNCYIRVGDSPAVRQSLQAKRIPHTVVDGVIQLQGAASLPFARLYNADLQRTMRLGCINSSEPEAIDVLARITSDLVGRAPAEKSMLVFSIPSPPIGIAGGQMPPTFLHHQLVLRRMFEELGYVAAPLPEGEAVIYAGLRDSGYTGLGISFGAGLVNVAFTYLALPVMAFSLERGGDMIDSNSATVVGEKATRVRMFKESEFAFTNENRDPTSRAIHMFYLDLIDFVVNGISAAFSDVQSLPQLDAPIPVVIAGGTAMPNGFLQVFERALRSVRLPMQLSVVRVAPDPLNAVALGCLEYAKANYSNE